MTNPASTPRSTRAWITGAAKLAFSGVLLGLLLAWVDLAALGTAIASVDVAALLLSALLMVIQLMALAWRWKVIVARLGTRLTALDSMMWTATGVFVNQALPSSVGGAAVRILLLRRRTADTGLAVASVLLERISGLVVLALMVSACAGILHLGGLDGAALRALLAVGPTALVAAALTVALAHTLSGRVPARIVQRFGSVAQGMAHLGRSPSALVELAALGALASGSALVAAWVLGRALGIEAAPWAYGAFVGGAVLLAVLPISVGGWGVREAGVVALFATIGAPKEPVLAMSLLWGLLPIVVSAPGALAWWMSTRIASNAPTAPP